jgi:hypothetical protein
MLSPSARRYRIPRERAGASNGRGVTVQWPIAKGIADAAPDSQTVRLGQLPVFASVES